MVSLLTAGSSGLAGLGAASVLRLRQFIAGKVDDIRLGMSRRKRELKTHKAFGEHDERDQQQAFQQPAGEHAAVGEDADGRFSG
jgi:hypothetical protein